MKRTSRPIAPKPPSKTLIEAKEIFTISFSDNHNGNLDFSLYQQLEDLQVASLNDLKSIYLVPKDDYSYTLEAVLKTELPNENYNSEMEKYNKDMEIFNKNLKEHEENIEARRAMSNKINELQDEITKLQKKLSGVD